MENRPELERERPQPKDYVAAVVKHSRQTNRHCLYPGINFRSLALFLGGNAYNPPNSTSQNRVLRDHDYAILHDLSYDRADPSRVTSFDSVRGIGKFMVHPLPHDDCGQLLFLRGHPSPEWASSIGAKYRIDPEIFRQHLALNLNDDFHDLPGPSPISQNILKLSITSLGRHNGKFRNAAGRLKELAEYQSSVGTDRDAVGESLVRKFAIHDSEIFSIEQDIYISVIKRNQGWLGLVILDNGRDLDEGPHGPWSEMERHEKSVEDVFVPVIQHEPGICFKELDKHDLYATSSSPIVVHNRRFFQSVAILPSAHYGHFLSSSIMKKDAFYALSEVFNFCAHSEQQFLNFLSKQFDILFRSKTFSTQMRESLENLTYHKSILREHIDALQTVLNCIRKRGNRRWPRFQPSTASTSWLSPPVPGPSGPRLPTPMRSSTLNSVLQQDLPTSPGSQMDASQAAGDELIETYEGLLQRARKLWEGYNDAIEDIRTNATLEESQKGTKQQENMTRLTLLAFLFLPLSFTTSFFGMNLKELGSSAGSPDLWVWAATSVPIFLLCLVMCFWTHVSSICASTTRAVLMMFRRITKLEKARKR